MKMKKGKSITICVCWLLLAAVLSMAGCTGRTEDSHTDERGSMNIDFGKDGMIRNGTAYETYQVEEGQSGIISVCISRKSGRLDLDVYPAGCKDAPEYTGRDLDSASFDVIVTGPGEYKVCVTAKEFMGDYEISWRTEDNTDK